ncbi:MAG: pyridoxamine 5'-phosphate oxidase family protein [Pseudomonadota bacterium]
MAEIEALDRARRLLRGAGYGTLATLDGRDGGPFASLVAMATTPDGAPVMLLSDLAEHTKNLAQDTRASILIDGTAGLSDRLTGPRLTLVGRVEPTTDDDAIKRYLLRHPSAALIGGFADFRHYRLVIERAHQVAGFGRIDDLDGGDLRVAQSLAADIAALEVDALARMNALHRQTLDVFGPDAVIAALDADGAELRSLDRAARGDFDRRLGTVSELDDAVGALMYRMGQDTTPKG